MKTAESVIFKRYQASTATAQSTPTITEKKVRQSQRIKEIREALIEAGYASLDQQASVLGLSRSSTWAVLRGNHKCSGLRPALIARMLNAPTLPPTARAVIEQYTNEKSGGFYGDSVAQCKRFAVKLNLGSGLFVASEINDPLR
jgi:hypothetical protein